VADFDTDHMPDLAVATIGSDNVTILPNLNERLAAVEVKAGDARVDTRNRQHSFRPVTLANTGGEPINGPVMLVLLLDELISRDVTLASPSLA
jgi:hypothetical protein